MAAGLRFRVLFRVVFLGFRVVSLQGGSSGLGVRVSGCWGVRLWG